MSVVCSSVATFRHRALAAMTRQIRGECIHQERNSSSLKISRDERFRVRYQNPDWSAAPFHHQPMNRYCCVLVLAFASRRSGSQRVRLNQVTVTLPDLDAGWRFYCALGLVPIVDSRPSYVRFVCPDGDSTFSLHMGDEGGSGITVYFECDDLDERVAALKAAGIEFSGGPRDQPWLWREAELFDPGGNRILLYHAGENRLNPPWRLGRKPGPDR